MKGFLFALSVFLLIAVGALPTLGNTAWSESSNLDTVSVSSGKSLELQPNDAIRYSTKWVNGYDRKITLFVRELASTSGFSFFSTGDTTTVYESSGDEEGAYVWNYTQVDPSVLPRNASYSLNYSVTDKNNGYEFGSSQALATITITPEPSVLFGFAALILAMLRKR